MRGVNNMPRGVYIRTSEMRKHISEAHKGKSWGGIILKSQKESFKIT